MARSSVRFDWITADAEYGRDGDFLDPLEQSRQRYLVEVPANTTVWAERPLRETPDEMVWQVGQLAETLPAAAWSQVTLREGTKGPLGFEFARLRVWSVRHRHAASPVCLLARRGLEPFPEVKYYLSNAEPETPLEPMALVSGAQWSVEEFFKHAKGQLGMGHYEARSWTSWHHHMSLVALAHLFVTPTKRDLKREIPDLTLDMALRLIRSAMTRLSVQDAMDPIDHHRARNAQAKESHRKSWPARHSNYVHGK